MEYLDSKTFEAEINQINDGIVTTKTKENIKVENIDSEKKVTIPIIKSEYFDVHRVVSDDIANTLTTEPNRVFRTITNVLKSRDGPRTPKAYYYHNIYENNRKNAIRMKRKEERKMREFSSRPAPNFLPEPTFHRGFSFLTIPITPEVLKRSKEFAKKQREKFQQQEEQRIKEIRKAAIFKAQPNPFRMSI